MVMSPEEIVGYRPIPLRQAGDDAFALPRAMQRMQDASTWNEKQVMGRRYAIGCVALEVTQRCNLDCTLCYLSELSESVMDIPLKEIFRRIDNIFNEFGPLTDVQITGGDPTLRSKEDLVAIVTKIREKGMRPTLMTNGIKATRSLMTELRAAGLNDIAIHVDLTQERRGYSTEVELNEVREKYIERMRGLGLQVIFNTTVHKNNFKEIPELIRFFKKHADVVGMASFQLQADTGRGLLRKRVDDINLDTVARKVREGAGADISFDSIQIGHSDCHRYSSTFVVNQNTHDIFYKPAFIQRMLRATAHVQFQPVGFLGRVRDFFTFVGKNPALAGEFVLESVRAFWKMRSDLVASGFRIKKQSYFIQNFMNADGLERDRVDACSFMVMTRNGPVSMCMHNAKRDEFILQGFSVATKDGTKSWDPLKGYSEEVSNDEIEINSIVALEKVSAGSHVSAEVISENS